MTPELNNLNFKDLLILDESINIDTYNFDRYRQNDRHLVKGYCTRCEEKGCNVCPTDKNFTLTNISHGASTDDLLLATEQTNLDFSDWHHDGVLFLMESPSVDGWGLYHEVDYNGYKKRPAKLWYWIHKKQEVAVYPSYFKGGEYGDLFKSIVFTFKLRNAYLTNLVKCGLNNTYNKFKGFKYFNPEAINLCYETFLANEIELIQPKVIFCFGSNVYDYLWKAYDEYDAFPWTVIRLPHPARGRNGFSNELFRHSYYSMIIEGLYEAGILTLDEAKEKYGEFLVLSERSNG